MSDHAHTLPQLIATIVAQRGDHDAIVMRSGKVSYAELNRRSADMARALLDSGAGKGTRIALMAPDGILWITAFLASARIGALLTVVSTLCTAPELAYILRNSDIQILIAARRFLRHDYANTLLEALPELEGAQAEKLQLTNAPYLRSIWLDDSSGIAWAKSIAELVARADSPQAPSAELLAKIEAEVAPSDDAVIIYTSGSTSKPKAVVHTQRTLVSHPREVAKYFLLQPDDRMMPLLPAFWLGGLVMALEVLSLGATLVYPDSPDIDVILDAIQTLNVNRVNSWGDMLVKLRVAAIDRGIDVDRIVGLGVFRDQHGEPIPPQLQVNMLGMSETFAIHSAERLDFRLPDDKARASGRVVSNYERRIVDPETGAEVAPGEIGELQLRGGALMSGFYKMERRDVFTADGFYPTKDLVRIDADGYLFFVARRGDMIKTKAANVSRLEVEAALNALTDVAFSVVAGLEDDELGQRVVAAVVPQTGSQPTAESLKTALKKTLSSYKIPRDIVFIEHTDVPRTSTGKIQLFEVANLIAQRLHGGS
jgi:acyl-CoA synthetase (AMP-forming)/AMP-acid ligase II